ncbi:MAG: rod shape-determining protein RodA [Candidatus Hydrogenedentes bacterium]|nr:rod shape-determining protein RodA [Candidatus Hydrogenedentota bacterium]
MNGTAQGLDLLDSHIRTFNYRNLMRVDWILVILTFTLVGIGLTTLYSASMSAASDLPFYLKFYVKQSAFFILGVFVAIGIVCVDYRALVSLAPVMFVGVIVLLVLVLAIGYTAMGGQHWLRYGQYIGLQPSELSKIALVYAMAWYLPRVGERIQRLPYLMLAFAIMGVLLLLILKQGDLGTAVVMSPIAVVMVYVAGCRKRHLLAMFLAGAIVLPLAYFNLDKLPLKEHQRKRIESFVTPEADPDYQLDAGYQIIQTTIAVGSGQMWGKGFGQGTQTHMKFLPEYHTDFIFALFAEERGFVGSIVVLVLYTLFMLRSIALARDCPDLAGSLLAIGCMSIIGFHVIVNIAITLHLLPVTGLPLPFLSYGGSFLMTTMMCVGTILSVNVRKNFFA